MTLILSISCRVARFAITTPSTCLVA